MVEPALMCAPGALFAGRLAGSKLWLHIQDFEVDAAFELGILPQGRMRVWAERIESAVMRRFDVVSTISGRMLERLGAKGVSGGVLFANWVDTDQVFPLSRPSALRDKLGLGGEEVVALYSGNMGAKQGLELLAQVARVCAGLQFVFCGNGPGRPTLEAACSGLANVRFLDLLPAAELNELLNLADIHLLPQRADAADLVMPSKLTGMLASGRPVVATASAGTQVAQVVEGRGAVVRPGDAVAMAASLMRLAGDAGLRVSLGAAARDYAVAHLGKEAILSAFERELISRVA